MLLYYRTSKVTKNLKLLFLLSSKNIFQNDYFLTFFLSKRNGLQTKEAMRWSNRVQAVTWAAEKIDQQLHKYVLPKVAFCCSTVWEVLGSESGGFGARKQKWNSSEIEQIKKVIIPIADFFLLF